MVVNFCQGQSIKFSPSVHRYTFCISTNSDDPLILRDKYDIFWRRCLQRNYITSVPFKVGGGNNFSPIRFLLIVVCYTTLSSC